MIMSHIEAYREKLRRMDSWDAYLLDESRLPGPRANLELAFAVALDGSEEKLVEYAEISPDEAGINTKEEFLAVCGVIGLGYLAARGFAKYLDRLRELASDPRWRIREAVALGLQEFGANAFEALYDLMIDWSKGSLLERRAVVATMCEPRLLQDQSRIMRILDLLERITASILDEDERRSEAFRVMRKALGYGWSVVVAADPPLGKRRMERWMKVKDQDIRWIMKNNLKKNRMIRMDPDWVDAQMRALAG
jgi:hypothetical protein